MKQIIIVILIAITLSFVYGQQDNRERVDIQNQVKSGKEMLVITYSMSPDLEAWFVVRRKPADTEGFLVGPNKMGDIEKANIEKAWMYFGAKRVPCIITENGLQCEVEKPIKEGQYYFSWEILTTDGKKGFSLVDPWSVYAYDPELDPKATRPNLEFRFNINATKGNIIPGGNIK